MSLPLLSRQHHRTFSLLAAFLAIVAYFYGLGSDHIATNGDELVYAQIARATAESNHWLPLQSPIARLQDTKPPLLFWQGMISTDWAQNWTLWNLRYPNVLYTLLTALIVALVARRFHGGLSRGAAQPHADKDSTGLIAALTFLSFFGIFRYGRCFLTSAPEVFWLSLPCFLVLAWPRLIHSWKAVPLLGIVLGIGLLYKSFMLVVPVIAILSWWSFQEQHYQLSHWFRCHAGKLISTTLIALGVFSLWFFLDPNPQAILQHFIIKENLGKFDAGTGSYLFNFFFGNSSIWRNVIAYPLNAGLLAPAIVALGILGWKNRSMMMREEQWLWMWLITVFVIFSFPNQRDERYLLLGMPALALLLEFYWKQIPRWIMVLSLAAVAIIVAGLVGLALLLQHHLAMTPWGAYHYPLLYWLLLLAVAGVVFLAISNRAITRACVCPSILLLYLCYGLFLLPFDGPIGHFNEAAQTLAVTKKIWVPINFNAREESYRFLLPHAHALLPYDYKANITIEEMKNKVPRFVISLPLTDHSEEQLQGATLLSRRLNLIDRFNAQETQAILLGDIAKYLFHQDLLIERKETAPVAVPVSP